MERISYFAWAAWRNATIFFGVALSSIATINLVRALTPFELNSLLSIALDRYRGLVSSAFGFVGLDDLSDMTKDFLMLYLLCSATFARAAFAFHHLRPDDDTANSGAYWKFAGIALNRFHSRWYRYFSIRVLNQRHPYIGFLLFFLLWPLIIPLLYMRTFFLFESDEGDVFEPDRWARALERRQLAALLQTFVLLFFASAVLAILLVFWSALA